MIILNTTEPVKDILAVTDLTDEEMGQLPTPEQVRKMIKRVRHIQDEFGEKPNSIAEVEVPALHNCLYNNYNCLRN